MDVDSLLAELDDVMDDKPSGPAKGGGRYTPKENFQQQPPPRRGAADSGGGDDIDALLADLGGMEPSPPARQPVSMSAKQSAPVASPGSFAFPGSSSSSSSGGGQRNATGLRCTKCDFKVLRFLDSAWSPDADYMFFRNFMPNVAKLEAKLVPSDGSCAYSCQCSWTSAELGEPHNVSNWFMAR